MLSLLMLTSCGTINGKPFTKVGDIKISENEFKFYLKSVKEEMKGTEFETEEDWQNKELDGRKAIELAKEQAMDNAVNNALYIETGKAAGIALTPVDKKNIEIIKQQFIDSKGSEKDYKKFLKDNGISDEFIDMLCESSVYYSKIAEVIQTDTKITDKMKEDHFENNKDSFEAEVRKAKHILIATIDPETMKEKSAEDKEAASRLAKELYDRVQSGEDFDKLMKEYSEDPGLETSPNGYVFRTGEMVKEFEETTDSIEPNQVAFCVSDYGYHIVLRLPITWKDAEKEVSDDLMMSLIEKRVEKWQKDYSIEVTIDEEKYGKIK